MPIKTLLKSAVNRFMVKTPFILTHSLNLYRKPFQFDISSVMDQIRLRSLDLVANEIYNRNIAGSVGELGVFKGDFAKFINKAFPDRSIYLFDTFEGFDKRDVKIENELNYSNGKQDFSGTSVKLVMDKMTYKENVVIRKGFFPESAIGVEENFCFVSIDTDLFEPIYQGLHWFSARMNSGGYIFVHDFNNGEYPGAHDAVIKFCQETGKSYFPLCDGGGSAVLSF